MADPKLPINVDPRVSPDSPADQQPTIGLIGMGAMGKMYADILDEAGWKKIHVCDLPEKYDALQRLYSEKPNISVLQDGHAVARSSDFIIYSVEAEFIDRVVAQFGPSTKVHAIVAGQTSVKAPEKAAFEKYLPKDVHIVSCHSLHGPSVSPQGQPLVLIKHRASDDALLLVETILSPLKSRFVYLSYDEHDLVTANTQAVTHAAFLSMGTAWASARSYPWEQGLYVGGIETAKVNLALRIYSNAWHVYAGLAILNPSARIQIDQYASSATELFKLMIRGGEEEGRKVFRERVMWAKSVVFGDGDGSGDGKGKEKEKKKRGRKPILLSADVLDRFSLAKMPPSPPPSTSNGSNSPLSPNGPVLSPPSRYRPNSHLSLLAMVDCWAHLRINPYHHLSVAATPIFRLFLGVAEHLFLSPASPSPSSPSPSPSSPSPSTPQNQSPLNQAIHSSLHDTWHRADDLEFVVAARGWSQCVSFGSFEVYKRRFDETRGFFEARFEEAGRLGGEMIKALMESEVEREGEREGEA
ncbi:uncharacterized protein LACBIDRAFT_248404 [Laccaria bicolor S238N-H82]|uniref:Predicted protein n=1 Tax=Laccaria bicolor (strain S238N-H82 / ATCC MYA-4686) TaxID=486041 RepID=B0D5V7_LACBS|nr:uncharacterized protein LACBIDRAFT_248404 [Laccaria bicolor S238N-H82]EDR10087.1 predicted protein [Laccaria bicolor S238N-H82]|eukprot:XP_001879472.1 predicted protein [Laccaria bicolor S238N-H82]